LLTPRSKYPDTQQGHPGVSGAGEGDDDCAGSHTRDTAVNEDQRSLLLRSWQWLG
jgi:hypothetical protein